MQGATTSPVWLRLPSPSLEGRPVFLFFCFFVFFSPSLTVDLGVHILIDQLGVHLLRKLTLAVAMGLGWGCKQGFRD